MIAKETLTFLKNLKRNNNREWLQANKQAFESAKDDFSVFVEDLIAKISRFDSRVQAIAAEFCVFRIYRDVRFSKDKLPYKTNFGAYISPGGRKSAVPGFYFQLEPGGSFLAAGKHNPESGEILLIRRAIASDTDGFLDVLKARGFRKCFGEIHGDRLKTSPKGFPADHKAAEYLRLKSFMAYMELHDDEFVTSTQFATFVASAFKEAKPLVDFLRKALSD